MSYKQPDLPLSGENIARPDSPVDDLVRRARRRAAAMVYLACAFWCAVVGGLVAVAGGPLWASVGFAAVTYFALKLH